MAIDTLRIEGENCPSLNSWVAEAIREKIERDSHYAHTKQNIESDGYPFFEFFAGGGMARAGLGERWNCQFANDNSAMKGQVYRKNWHGGPELVIEDVNKITTRHLSGTPDLIWASFPCQDLSLAGNYEGIGHRSTKIQTRSGTFWPFWKLIRTLMEENRSPKLIVLENVYGALTSHGGKDFAAIGSAFSGAGYRFGALVVDAKHFVPQSRQRVFVIGVRNDAKLRIDLIADAPAAPWHPASLQKAYEKLSKEAQKKWIWWNLPIPPQRQTTLTDLIEDNPVGVAWHTSDETNHLLSLMNDVNLAKVNLAKKTKRRMVGGVYRRTRSEEDGTKVQRAEVRFDDIAGCLRTPSGGSSRQTILVIEGTKIRSRLLSPREAARLMGLPDTYVLPAKYNDAYHVAGDGVVVPVVRHLSNYIFEPIIESFM
ncbi:Site-specific DNA methylase [Janthinobacterium sp. Marseille]|nr:Site-specific DNA methylase [Janthinobacterium sp. Marseille]